MWGGGWFRCSLYGRGWSGGLIPLGWFRRGGWLSWEGVGLYQVGEGDWVVSGGGRVGLVQVWGLGLFCPPPTSHERELYGVTSAFTRLIMKTKNFS